MSFSDSTTFFGGAEFDALSVRAAASPRRRINHNFHGDDSDPAHRFLNAVEPGSYIRPHRHIHPLKAETFVAVRGSFGIALFDDAGNVTAKSVIAASGVHVGVHVPAGVYHTLVALEPGSILFEVKAGPYDVRTDKDWGAWAPAENDAEVATYAAALRALFE